MARNIAQKLYEAWAQSVVVENRTGAGGIIGADAVAKSPPMGTPSCSHDDHRNQRQPGRKVPLRHAADLQPVAMLSSIRWLRWCGRLAGPLAAGSRRAIAQAGVDRGFGRQWNAPASGARNVQGRDRRKDRPRTYKGGAPRWWLCLALRTMWCFRFGRSAFLREIGQASRAGRDDRNPAGADCDVPTTAEAGFASVQARAARRDGSLRHAERKSLQNHAEVNSIMAAPD